MTTKLETALHVVIAKQMYWDALRKFEVMTAGPSGEWSSYINDKVSDCIENLSTGDPTAADIADLVTLAEGSKALKVSYEPCGFTADDRRPNRVNIYGPMLMDQAQLRKTLEAEDIEEVVIYAGGVTHGWHIKLNRRVVKVAKQSDVASQLYADENQALSRIEGTL